MQNIFDEQRKTRLIQVYLDSLRQYKLEAGTKGSKVNISVGDSNFTFDTQRTKVLNKRQVTSR